MADAHLDGDRLVLDGAGARVEVALAQGTFAVESDGWRPFAAAHAGVRIDGEEVVSDGGWAVERAPERFEDAHGAGLRAVLVSRAPDCLLRLEAAVYDAAPFVLLRLGVGNTGRRARTVETLSPLATGGLAFEAPPRAWRIFRHGWQSWTPSLSLGGAQRDLRAGPPVHAPAPVPAGRGAFASEEVAALLDPASGRTFTAGFVSARAHWTQVRVRTGRRALACVAETDAVTLAPGETLWSERLLIDASSDASSALARYAAALAREMNARVPPEVPTGWCSWYQYFTAVTEADILANLRFLQEHRRTIPIDTVQIDDGYQAEIGDWLQTNDKFPRGMRALAEDIRAAGFTPGIWLAPFIAGARSELLRQHPDWMIRDASGGPARALTNWGQECYGIDCTHPGAQRWLRDVFGTVVHDWGYDYLKIDFLYGAALAGRRHDARASRIEAYRRGLETVREVAGDRFVLGCGALMGPSAGLIDAQRIGPDVAPWWRWRPRRRETPPTGGEPSAEHAIRNVLTRAWMHGRLWANDPDCLLVRTSRTKLTLAEVRSLATAIAMSGGAVLLSDDMTGIPPERLDIVSLLLPPLGLAPVAPHLMDASMPSRLDIAVARDFDPYRLVALFNWSGRRRPLQLTPPDGRWHVFELWQERAYGIRAGALALPDVEPHGARLLALRPALDRPQLVGTTLHASMGGRDVEGASWDGEGRVLRLAFGPVARSRGRVAVAVPAGFRLREARIDGAPVEAQPAGDGVVAFDITPGTATELALRFE